MTKINQKSCFNMKDYNKAEIQKMKENIKKYIDDNAYLFKTDTIHTVQLHLKPRMVSQSVENSCIACKKNVCIMDRCKNYSNRNEKRILKSNFTEGMKFAIKYINKKDKD